MIREPMIIKSAENSHAQAGLPVEIGEAFGRGIRQRGVGWSAEGNVAEHGASVLDFGREEKRGEPAQCRFPFSEEYWDPEHFLNRRRGRMNGTGQG